MDILYRDEYIEIAKDATGVFLKSFKDGLTLESFSKLQSDLFPSLKVTSFTTLRNILTNAPRGPEKFAEDRERISLRISDDGLKAWLTFYVTEKELHKENRSILIQQVKVALKAENIVFGIHLDILADSLRNGVEYLIAEGLQSIEGKDAVIRTYEKPETKPTIIENGQVNFFEMNLITAIQEGDWLGERDDPTPGTTGITVTGKEIAAKPGKMVYFDYDKPSVIEVPGDQITYLYARKTGALFFNGTTIGVYDYLEIKGNVDYTTGNVQFDGNVGIKGTVEDGFSVTAQGDIEINHEYGVGAVERIESLSGSIVIKGGIAGKGKAVIRAAKDVYVKYVSEAEIECGGTVYIGFYAMNSTIRANRVVVESSNGRITGGSIEAVYSIEAAEIGNKSGTRTVLHLTGFRRYELDSQYEKGQRLLDVIRNKLTSLKEEIRKKPVNTQDASTAELAHQIDRLKTDLKEREYLQKQMSEYIKVPGEGAIIVKKHLFTKVRAFIGDTFFESVQEEPGAILTKVNGEIVVK